MEFDIIKQQKQKISQKKEKYLTIKTEKKSNTMIIEKLITLNEIINRNNNNHSNIFKRLYR